MRIINNESNDLKKNCFEQRKTINKKICANLNIDVANKIEMMRNEIEESWCKVMSFYAKF